MIRAHTADMKISDISIRQPSFLFLLVESSSPPWVWNNRDGNLIEASFDLDSCFAVGIILNCLSSIYPAAVYAGEDDDDTI